MIENNKVIQVKKKLTKNYNFSGLSLIEMIVSLSVVMLVATIFIYNYRDNNKRTDLTMAAQVLVTDIHRAQNNSLGLLKYGSEVPAGGWGLYFDLNNPNQYVMFADLEEPGESGYRAYNPQLEGDVNQGARVVELARGIEISGIYLGVSNPKSQASVTFLPPNPQVNIYSGGSTSTDLYINLHDIRNDNLKTIVVNFLGLAEVID